MLLAEPLAGDSTAPASSESGGIAFVDVAVLTMEGDEVLEGQTVLVDGALVSRIGPTDEVEIPEGARCITGAGCTLLPGLVDLRVQLEDSQELWLHLAHGVTSVRIMNGRPFHLDLREAVESGERIGPRILAGAPPLDGNLSAGQSRRAVADAARFRYDFVEIGPGLRPAAWQAALAEAKRHSLPVFGSVPLAVGLEPALSSELRVIDHAESLIGFDPQGSGAEPSPDEIRAIARRVSEAGVRVAPALVAFRALIPAVEHRSELLEGERMSFVTPYALQLWSAAGHAFRRDFVPDDLPRLEASFAGQRQLVRALHELDVPLLVGTDSMKPFVVPGFAVHDELALLVECGLTPLEALRAATANAAEALGRSDLGRVREGAAADLLLVEGEPWRELAALRRRRGVCVRGGWIEQEVLERRVEELVDLYRREAPVLGALAVRGPEWTTERYREVLAGGSTAPTLREETLDRTAELMLAARRWKNAVGLSRAALELHPQAAWAHLRLARSLLASGETDAARACLARALELRPDGVEALLLSRELGLASESSPSAKENWPRFRGPNGSGWSSARELPARITAADVNWRRALPGRGHSSPVVWEGRVFVTSTEELSARGPWEGPGRRSVVCLGAEDGETIWRRDFEFDPCPRNRLNSFASATPTVDAEHLYLAWTSGESLQVLALDHHGAPVWEREFSGHWSLHGSASSPIVVGEVVVVSHEYEGSENFLLGLDRQSGETRWRRPRPLVGASFATPCVYCPGGDELQVLFASPATGLTSLDPATGELIWELGETLKAACVASPIVAGELVITSHGGKSTVAIRPGTGAAIAYRVSRNPPHVPTPIEVGELLFLWDDGGIVSCLRATTGEEIWRERVPGEYYGSPVYAGGRLYAMSREGELVVIAAGESFELLDRVDLGEPSHATPAIADGVMYLRTEAHLVSIGG